MAAPLAAAAALAAARLIATQLAKQGAKKVITKSAKKSVKTALKTAKKTKPLSSDKSTAKFVKNIQKTGKPGDVQKTLDSMSLKDKRAIAASLKKVNKPNPNKPGTRAKQASPSAIKVRSKSTGKLKTIKLD